MKAAARALVGIFFAVAIGSSIATLNWVSISRSFAKSGDVPIDPLAGVHQWATVTLVALVLVLLAFVVERVVGPRAPEAS